MGAFIPSWAATVGALRDNKVPVSAHCDRCRIDRRIDPAKIAAAKGDAYSLVDRRCRCKFTEGCTGWISFSYLHGVMRPLRTEAFDRRIFGLPPSPARR